MRPSGCAARILPWRAQLFALQFSPRDGARFAAGFASCGCGLRSLGFAGFGREGRELTQMHVKSGNSRPNPEIRGLQMNNLDSLLPTIPPVFTERVQFWPDV